MLQRGGVVDISWARTYYLTDLRYMSFVRKRESCVRDIVMLCARHTCICLKYTILQKSLE